MRRPALPDARRAPLPHPRRPGDALSPDALHAWFEDWLDALNRHDLDAVGGLLHPDVRRAGAPRGSAAWLRDLAELLAAFPDQRWKRIAVVVEGDRLAAHTRTRGTHRGTWRAVRSTGRRVSSAEFGFFRVQHGRIAEYAGGADPGLAQQLAD